jgi:hypothetical protein
VNSKSDKNVETLRLVLLRTMQNDPLDYLNDPIPKTWLACGDALSKMDEPFLRVSSADETESTVVSVMRESEALAGCDDDQQKCDSRARAMLQFFNLLGVVTYFDGVPGLMNRVILGPQLVMDSITYVVRDFKLHRFRRDRKAKALRDGGAWTNLLVRGILEYALLDFLWIGEREHHDFLISLMEKLGMFAKLHAPDPHGGGTRYLVPCTVSSVSTTACWRHKEPRDVAARHLSSDGDGELALGTFDFRGYLPTGMFERTVNKLVSGWPRSYADCDPVIEHNAAFLRLGKVGFVIVLDKSAHIIRSFAAAHCIQDVNYWVNVALNDVNREIYADRISVDTSGAGLRQRQLRNDDDDRAPEHAGGGAHDIIDPALAVRQGKTETLFAFFSSAGLADTNARKYARLLIEDDEDENDLRMLKRIYDRSEDRFLTFLEQACGCHKIGHQDTIMAALKTLPPPEPPQPYLLGYFGGASLDHVKLEKSKVAAVFAPGKLKADCRDMSTVRDLDKRFQEKIDDRVLHLAMHGGVPGVAGHHTLAFMVNERSGAIVTQKDLASTIAFWCKHSEPDAEGRTIECVFINACQGSEIAKAVILQLEEDEQYDGTAPICFISWRTDLVDEAACDFAESFYNTLSPGTRSFEMAFKAAQRFIELDGWVTDGECGDPDVAVHCLQRLSDERGRQDLKPAGIPVMYCTRSKGALRTAGAGAGAGGADPDESKAEVDSTDGGGEEESKIAPALAYVAERDACSGGGGAGSGGAVAGGVCRAVKSAAGALDPTLGPAAPPPGGAHPLPPAFLSWLAGADLDGPHGLDADVRSQLAEKLHSLGAKVPADLAALEKSQIAELSALVVKEVQQQKFDTAISKLKGALFVSVVAHKLPDAFVTWLESESVGLVGLAPKVRSQLAAHLDSLGVEEPADLAAPDLVEPSDIEELSALVEKKVPKAKFKRAVAALRAKANK